MISTILLILLILMLLGVLPTWPHSRGWGYYPSGGLGLIVLILIILLLLGRISARQRTLPEIHGRGWKIKIKKSDRQGELL
ncbi:MAG: DUF3309 domain-containing protein [Proteobacteria bacterium]|nr:DUF3309 domain-containing protein [Pseudomonadota bacterium]